MKDTSITGEQLEQSGQATDGRATYHTRMSIQELHESIGFEDSFDDELDGVDGSDVERVTRELIDRGGADAVLGRFLRDRVSEYYAAVDPESSVDD